jgi:nodulation protein F
MASDCITGKTIAIIARHATGRTDPITPDLYLEDLRVDSLMLTEIIMDLEEEFDIDIEQNTAEAAASFKTVADIVSLVERLRA